MITLPYVCLVDIDGTLCELALNEDLDYELSDKLPPINSIVDLVNQYYETGSFVCLFSAREESHREMTERWLEKNGVKYHQLILDKPRVYPDYAGYIFIDDNFIAGYRVEGEVHNGCEEK